jgi:hypothetical protein
VLLESVDLLSSVVDSCGTNRDPQIRTTKLRIRLQIGILLFSSVAFKMSTNKSSNFFAFYFLKVNLHQSSHIKGHKEVTKH